MSRAFGLPCLLLDETVARLGLVQLLDTVSHYAREFGTGDERYLVNRTEAEPSFLDVLCQTLISSSLLDLIARVYFLNEAKDKNTGSWHQMKTASAKLKLRTDRQNIEGLCCICLCVLQRDQRLEVRN